METELKNFQLEGYNPSKTNDAQLADDWRLICAKYATMVRGGKTEFETIDECQQFAVKVLAEILKRGKITFHPDQMKETSLDLLRFALGELIKGGLYLVAPHGEWFYTGKKTAMVKSRRFKRCRDFNILCSENKAYGYIRFKEPDEINLPAFTALRSQHRISEAERESWWPSKKVLYLYDLRDFIALEKPRKIDLPQGVQVFVDKVVFHSSLDNLAERLPWLIRNAQELPEFVWKPDFVCITGSTIFADRKPNDMDIVIRADKIDSLLSVKLQRALSYHFDAPQLHWVPEPSGPNWPYLPIYDLVLRPRKSPQVIKPEEPQFQKELYHQRAATPEVEQQARRSRQEDKLVLSRFYLGMKPTRITLEGKRQTVERFVDLFSKDDFPVFNSKKYDGMRLLIFKDKDRVEIWSEDGVNNTHRLPNVCKSIASLKHKNFIIEAELEQWIDNVHQPREAVAGYLHSTQPVDDSTLIANVYTCLFLSGEDLHRKSEEERQHALDQLGIDYSTNDIPEVQSHNLNKVPNYICNSKEELLNSTNKLRFFPASEGVVAKKAKSVYYLDGNAREGWIKFHNSAVLVGKVSEAFETKTAGVFNYAYAIRPGDFEVKRADLVEVGGEELVEVGKTFSTSVECQRGDLIEVEFETFNLIHDKLSDTWRVSAWAPVFLRSLDSRGEPDTIEDVVDKAREEHILQEKVITEEETIYLSHSSGDPYMHYPDESKAYHYVNQHHYRGRSCHSDLRFETDKGYLIGWTLLDSIEDKVDKDVLTLEDARHFDKQDIWKIDWEMGKVKERKVRGGATRPADIRALEKKPEPIEWLKVEGATPPGTPGSTKEFPGVFSIVDKGIVEFGTQKPYFHEYFLSQGILKNRICFRMIGRESLSSPLTGEGQGEGEILPPREEETPVTFSPVIARSEATKQSHFKVGLHHILPPGEEEEAPRVPYYWVFMQPLDQTPYVLSDGAIEKDWLPPKGISALPKSIRDHVPDRLKFWNLSRKEALEARKELASMEELVPPQITHSTNSINSTNSSFILQHHWWRGPIIVRFGPSTEHWDLRIAFPSPSMGEGKGEGEKEIWHLVLKNNPLHSASVMGYEKPCTDPEAMEKGKKETEELDPGTVWNPTKDTPAFIKALDFGNCIILEDSATFKKVEFKGDKLNGLFIFTREDESDFWTISQSELPQSS